jgi:hypothetical protein
LSGKIKRIIDQIILERSNGNPAIAQMTIAKLILKGFNPNQFDSNSTDDEEIINKLFCIAKQLNVMNSAYKNTNMKSAFSKKSLESEVAADIKAQLCCFNSRLLIFFASSSYDQQKLSCLLQEAFSNCIVVGCSTAGELISGSMLNDSVVAMAISSNIISDAKTHIVDLKDAASNIDEAFSSFEKYFNTSAYTMDTTQYVGLILIDGLCNKEEMVMDLIGNRTNIIFVGGSAGDNFNFIKTHVCANGQAFTNSAALILLKLNDNTEFSVLKTHSFKVSDNVLTATKVNEEMREVIEFNNKPAAIAYAEALGVPLDDISQYFFTNPVGLIVGQNDIFIRSPQEVKGTSIVFYCSILEGMDVTLLKPTDILEDTDKAVKDKLKELGNIDGIIGFHCVKRAIALGKLNQIKQYGEIFKDISSIGFCSYGEQYIGHMNQSATMLLFKQKNKNFKC